MPIAANFQMSDLGSRVGFLPGAIAGDLGAPAPATAPTAPDPAQASTAATFTLDPSIVRTFGQIAPQVNPTLMFPPIRTPIIPFPIPLPMPSPKLTTAVAVAAIDQLSRAVPTSIRQAINAATSRQLTPDGLMDFLVRRVKISEVLGQSAEHWVPTTAADFTDAFQLQPNQLETMDCIVSLAILNDRDLESELRAENTPPATPVDLLQNRRVVWQWPPAGTVLSPPYVILVAVDSQDAGAATDVVQAILGQLSTFQGFKLPTATIQKLG